ncbi:MAG: ThuA domain-containing protein [Saprospiraceae bacterium]|nr:ThuA domain-containing protein [Saprospiraceae bacterium]
MILQQPSIKSSSTLLLLIFMGASSAFTQTLGTFTVHTGAHARINSPVFCSLDGITMESETFDLELVEWQDGREVKVNCQFEAARNGLWWILDGDTPRETIRTFELRKVAKEERSSAFSVTDDGSKVALALEGKDILAYQYAKAKVPEGVDPVYSRGGFIHPLWSPNGEVLTRIQPPDHYHHYGIWNPWTHTEFRGQEIDFWNLVKRQATVEVPFRPVVTTGDVYSEIKAVHHHVVKADSTRSEDEAVLSENFSMRAWNADPDNAVWVVDIRSDLNCIAPDPLTIKAYRYQGFGFRANARWDDQNVRLLTSEGLDKANGNATRARWCIVEGPGANNTAGVSFMTHPSNFNFPETIRIWPVGSNDGKENVFFNFNPAQERDWILRPNQTHTLSYRLLVYDGSLDSTMAQSYWTDLADPPHVSFQKYTDLAGKKILVYTKNGEGYVHDNIPTSIRAIQKLGEEFGFMVDASEDPSIFTAEQLKQFDALVFSNTNNDIFGTKEQEEAFQDYVRSGGGFVGLHSASGSERDWPWFWQMLGGKFYRHAPHQEFEVQVLQRDHPSTAHLPASYSTADECYYLNQLNPDIEVLLVANLNTVEDEKMSEYPGETFGSTFPLSWCHRFDGGRQWYTALGHDIEHYEDHAFMKHILGGIQWVLQKD